MTLAELPLSEPDRRSNMELTPLGSDELDATEDPSAIYLNKAGILPYLPKHALDFVHQDMEENFYIPDEDEMSEDENLNSFEAPFHGVTCYNDESGQGRLILNNEVILDSFGARFKDADHAESISLSDFQYVDELGRGEQGRIFLALHTPSNTRMAIKEIPLEMSEVQMKHILIELEVLSKHKSLFIIEFFGAFFTKSSVYFCMEVMDLGSLDDLIKALKNRNAPYPFFPDSFLAAVIYSISSGLNFACKQLSIMHRDIKPTNVLLNSKGFVKICDFGVSGYLVKSAAKTYVGSMNYMAPERVRVNQNAVYTIQADVWSLGAAVFEMILGDPLYAVSGFDSAFAHLMAISVEPCPPIPETLCSPAMASLIRSFLAKKPTDRPTFEEIMDHPLVRPYSDTNLFNRAVIEFLRSVTPEAFYRIKR